MSDVLYLEFNREIEILLTPREIYFIKTIAIFKSL